MGFFYDNEDERQRLEQQRRLAKLNRERKSAERKRSVLVEPDDEEEVLNQRSRISNGDYDDDDDEEDLYFGDPEEALIRLLKRIGSIRDQLDHIQGELNDLLQEEPELAQQYHQFLQQGGITAEDFERFQLNLLRPRIIRSRRHLRLVATSKAVKRSRPRLQGGTDDDAA